MVKITCDSTADLTSLSQENDISVIPLMVILGNDTYYDGVDINPDIIYDYVSKNKVLPKTAARSADDYYEFFKPFIDEGRDIVHFSISNKLSMSYNSALEASKRFESGKVYVIDGLSLSSGTALLALHGRDMAKNNHSALEIYENCVKRVPFIQASFVVDTMDYLYKGGRCSGLAAFTATALKIKPTLLLKDGKIVVGKKYLGRSIEKLIESYVDNILKEFNTPDRTRIFITHTSASPQMVNKVRQKLSQGYGFTNIIENIAGATITSHCGKNTLGILFINDNNL